MTPVSLSTVTWVTRVLTPIAGDASLIDFIARAEDCDYGLAHFDDGVLWGVKADGRFVWSTEALPGAPALRARTLRQLRLFGPTREYFVWREGDRLAARELQEITGGTDGEYVDRALLLWGRPEGGAMGLFQPMAEGKQGLRHAPPITLAKAGKLVLRHYIRDDENGCARIVASRLVVIKKGDK